MAEGLELWAIVGSSVAAAIGLVFNAYEQRKHTEELKMHSKELKQNETVNRAEYWLRLREFMTKYDDVHFGLRSGRWIQRDPTLDELFRIEAYMGLFEHCYRMINDEVIDLDTFEHIYGYRLFNILANVRIVTSKLKNERSGWVDFIELCKVVLPMMRKKQRLTEDEYSDLMRRIS
jgi:hypothetical protein